MEVDNTKIKKININKDCWISFIHDKLCFGGSFLPCNIHITISYGIVSKHIDFHLTKNLKNGERRHVPLVRIHQENFVPVLQRISMGSLRLLQEVNVNRLFAEHYVFIPLPVEESKEYNMLIGEVKSIFSPLVREKGKAKYRVTLEDKQLTELFEALCTDKTDSFFYQWLKNNLYNPKIINKLNGSYGIVWSGSKFDWFMRLPCRRNRYKNFIVSSDLMLIDTLQFFKNLLEVSLGVSVVDKLIEKWHEALDLLQKSDDSTSFENIQPLLLNSLM